MTIGSDLLKLLEPAVRPGGLAGPARAASAGPIESRSFESLLAEATSTDDSDGTDPTASDPLTNGAADAKKNSNVLGSLCQVDRIDNQSVRGLVGGA